MRFQAGGFGKVEVARKVAELAEVKPSIRAVVAAAGDAEKEKAYEDAVAIFERGIALYPESADLLNASAWFLVTVADKKFRNAKRAEKLAREAVELSKGKAGYILDTFAEALYQLGDLEAAVENAEKAARLETHPDIADRAKRFRAELEKKRGASETRTAP